MSSSRKPHADVTVDQQGDDEDLGEAEQLSQLSENEAQRPASEDEMEEVEQATAPGVKLEEVEQTPIQLANENPAMEPVKVEPQAPSSQLRFQRQGRMPQVDETKMLQMIKSQQSGVKDLKSGGQSLQENLILDMSTKLLDIMKSNQSSNQIQNKLLSERP